MENADIRLGDALIFNADESSRDFITQWLNSSKFIVVQTSGSTGIPKQIKLLKSDMETSARATCRFFNISKGSMLLSPLSADYIAGKMMIVRAIVSGAKLWIEKPSNRPINRDYGTIELLPIVPSQIEAVINSQYISRIKNIIIGGAEISPELELKISKSNISAYATYGMTETCSHVALRKIGESDNKYLALPHFTFSVDDRQCLIIKSETMSFKSIITNDIVELIDEYSFRWLGRFDNVINTGGVKVFPEKIEKRIGNLIPLPYYIIGEKDAKWGTKVILYIEGDEFDTTHLYEKLHPLLDKYSMPKEIRIVHNFVRTASGKIKRMLL